jgi:SAM-dependent methyltransferase
MTGGGLAGMDDDTTFVFEGRRLQAHEARALFADAPLTERERKVLEQIEGTAIVDVGCSTGAFVRAASRRFPDRVVIGVDADEDSLRIARFLDPQLAEHFRTMSAYHLDLPDASLDCATALEVLEHLEGAALALKEINRVLRPGGALIITVPNPYYLARLVRFCLSESANLFRRWRGRALHLAPEVLNPAITWDRHVVAWTPPTLLALLCANGFGYVEHEYENGMPDLFRRLVLMALPFLGPTLIMKVRKVGQASPDLV